MLCSGIGGEPELTLPPGVAYTDVEIEGIRVVPIAAAYADPLKGTGMSGYRRMRHFMRFARLAVKMVCEKAGWSIGDIDFFELNEAFASQTLAGLKALEINGDNVNGGAIALGHPIGASGARILTTLLYAMADRGATKGVAALCLGGGNAVAMAVER